MVKPHAIRLLHDAPRCATHSAPSATALNAERHSQHDAGRTEDLVEGVRALVEKRPKHQGR
jgi:enoyl-CoA hydratase/carnithine racemase